MTLTFKSALRDIQKKVDRSLGDCVEGLSCPSLHLKDALQYGGLTSGKRLRAFLHMIFARHFDVPEASCLHVATAIELMHAYSLIHDDLPCMDNSDLRRGLPTVHRQYDEATALLTGTSLLTYGFQLLTHSVIHKKAAVRTALIEALAQAVGAPGMMSGQMLDLEGETKLFSLEQIMEMQNLKTGALFSFCCEGAAILGEQPKEVREYLRAYAYHFGLAFQMTDDFLDHVSTEEQIGKSVRQDENKSTFLRLLGTDGAREQILYHGDQALQSIQPFSIPLAEDLVRFVLDRVHTN